MLGEIFEDYKEAAPNLYTIFEDKIIKYEKEFPYAIWHSNIKLTGKSVKRIIELFKTKTIF